MKRKGFTLFEMVMILIVAGIAIPPLTSLLVRIHTDSMTVLPLKKPNTLAVEIMEEIKGKKWDENWIGGPLDNSDKTFPGNLGLDSGETVRKNFDDIDDYLAIQNAVPTDIEGNLIPEYQDFRVTVEVFYVPGFESGSFDFSSIDTRSPPVSNSKRVNVFVTKGSQRYEVSTIVCNY